MKLLRVNNKLSNVPPLIDPITRQIISATYSSSSAFNVGLNYPLTLSENAKIGLLDCLIKLPNNYIVVIPNEGGKPFFRIRIGNGDIKKVILQLNSWLVNSIDEQRYDTLTFKHMLEWSLNGVLSFNGFNDNDFSTGFNFACPTYSQEEFNITKQPTLKIAWDRSDPNSNVDIDDVNLTNSTYLIVGGPLTKNNGNEGVYDGYAIMKTYFTKGAGAIRCSVDSGLLNYGVRVGLKIPRFTDVNNPENFFLSCSVEPDNEISPTKLIYKIGYYNPDEYRPDLYVYLIDGGDFNYGNSPIVGEFEALENDIILIYSTNNPNDEIMGGIYGIEIARPQIGGGFLVTKLIEIPKPCYLQWDSTILTNVINLKDLQGCIALKSLNSTTSGILFTSDPFHVVDTVNNTEVNLRDTDINIYEPILRDIIPCDIRFDFNSMNSDKSNMALWKDLFQFGKSSFVFNNSIRGQIIGLKPIDYGRLRFPINILIDNIDLESYDTSIKDKESLLFCLSESNLSPFDAEGDILAVKYTCQNSPLMIKIRNKVDRTLNKLKMRLTDNYYKEFPLDPNTETHLNILVSDEEEEMKKKL